MEHEFSQNSYTNNLSRPLEQRIAQRERLIEYTKNHLARIVQNLKSNEVPELKATQELRMGMAWDTLQRFMLEKEQLENSLDNNLTKEVIDTHEIEFETN